MRILILINENCEIEQPLVVPNELAGEAKGQTIIAIGLANRPGV